MTHKTMLHLLVNLFFATILFGALLGGRLVMKKMISGRFAL